MKYNTFLWLFVLSVIAGVIFIVFYVQAILSIVHMDLENRQQDPFAVLGHIFTPSVLLSLLAAFATGLIYRVMGIVWVAKNQTATGGEKALWIIGFILLGFITGIVFLALAKSRKLIPEENTSAG